MHKVNLYMTAYDIYNSTRSSQGLLVNFDSEQYQIKIWKEISEN